MKQYALAYADQLGWNVIPVDKNKRPWIKWEKYQEQKVTAKEIEEWWDRWPSAGIAVITGEISGLVVVDVENSEGLPFINEHVEDATKSTLVSKTGGGGWHLFFKHPGNVTVPNAVKIFPNVDVRGDGGYVVVPPSLHHSGNQYKWELKAKPSPLPLSLQQKLFSPKHRKLSSGDWQVDIPEGKRDEELTRRAGKLLQIGIAPGEALNMLIAWDQAHCKPPLGEEEIRKIVNSIHRKELVKQEKIDGKFKVMSFADTLEKYGHMEVDWNIQDWLPDATCGLVVAPPGTYKTWLLLSLSWAIATGEPFLGQYEVNNPGPVIFIQQEDPFPMLFDRVTSIMNMGKPWEEDDQFVLPLPPDPPPIYWHTDRLLNFKDKESLEGLTNEIKRVKPRLVVVDPLYSTVDSKDYMAEGAQMMLALKKIRDEHKCSFVIAHHTVKGGENSKGREGAWGSQFLNAWLETGWQIRPKEDQQIGLQRHFKQCSNPKYLKIGFKINEWEFKPTIQEGGEDVEDFSVQVSKLLSEMDITSQRQVAERLGMSGLGTVSRIFKELGVVKEGKYYRLP